MKFKDYPGDCVEDWGIKDQRGRGMEAELRCVKRSSTVLKGNEENRGGYLGRLS